MYRKKVESKYAREQMEKFGWNEGLGLGKQEDGMTDVIKVKLKFDQHGVGHDPGKEFKDKWWEDVYNQSAKKLTVQSKGKEGVTVSVTKAVGSKKPEQALLYGRFRKGATLTNSDVGQVEVKHGDDEDSSDDDDKEDQAGRYMTYEEMFKVCGGRTAHKGARHGLTQKGKLQRLEEHEAANLPGQPAPDSGQFTSPALPTASSPPVPGEDAGAERKKKKKRRKEDREEALAACLAASELSNGSTSKGDNSQLSDLPAEDGDQTERVARRKKKKKREERVVREMEDVEAQNADSVAVSSKNENRGSLQKDHGDEFRSQKKKKKKQRMQTDIVFDENCPDCVEEAVDETCSDRKSSKRKRDAELLNGKGGNSGSGDEKTELSKKRKRKKRDST